MMVPDETDAADHLRGNARHVETMVFGGQHPLEAVGREYHEECRTQCHEEVGAEAGLLGPVLAFESDGSTKEGGYEDVKEEIHK